MAPHPDNSNSSGATVAMIAAVVIGVLILGILAMVTLGFLFFFTVREPDFVFEAEPFAVEIVEQLPIETPATVEPPMDDQTVATEPDLPVPTEPVGDGDRPDVAAPTDLPEPAVIPPTESPRKNLADLTPLERLDVRLGDAPLVRAVNVGGRSYPSAIWAQPQTDLGTCQISYPVQQAYSRLTGMAAVSDAADENAAVVPKGTFRIYADGNLLWDSGLIEGYGSSKSFDLDVAASGCWSSWSKATRRRRLPRSPGPTCNWLPAPGSVSP
jgi:hypothetical protein